MSINEKQKSSFTADSRVHQTNQTNETSSERCILAKLYFGVTILLMGNAVESTSKRLE